MSIFGKKPDQPTSSPSTPSGPSPNASPSPSPSPKPSPSPSPSPKPSPSPSPAPRPAAPSPAAKTDRSFLGAGCELVGELSGEGSFECGGRFEGTIEVSGDIVVNHGGSAKAQITARRISIEGRLEGNATGSEKVEVGAAGHVEGDVRAPAVQFAEGAFFEGNVEMRRAKGAAQAEAGKSEASGDASSS